MYDLLIPKEDLLKKINELIDFSFIYDELVGKYCLSNARTAECLVRIFKYLRLKTIYSISNATVVERSRFDISFKYFLEKAPEDGVINSSSLTNFRNLRLKDSTLLNLLIGKKVAIAIEKGIVNSKSVIVDAIHIPTTNTGEHCFSVFLLLKLLIVRRRVFSYINFIFFHS